MERKYIDILMESTDAILKQAKIIETLDPDPDLSDKDRAIMFKLCDEKVDEALKSLEDAKKRFNQ